MQRLSVIGSYHSRFSTISSFFKMTGRPRIVRDSNSRMITVIPPIGKHSASVVIMHGLGDSAEGFSDVAEILARAMPHVKFILPTAPESPVTLNGGMTMNSWYDITGLGDRASEDCEGIENSVDIVRRILANENSLGVPFSRMVLAGFSQVSI